MWVELLFPSLNGHPVSIADTKMDSNINLCFQAEENLPNDKFSAFSVPAFSSNMLQFSSIPPESYCGD